MRNKILSLLVLLLTAATGAWAQSPHYFTDLINEIGNGGDKKLAHDYYKYDSGEPIVITASGVIDGNGAIIDMEGASISHVFYISADNVTIKNLSIINYTGTGDAIYFSGTGGSVINVCYNGTLSPGTSANTWTLSMPASDVLLTPIYSAATIYQKSGESLTEKKAYESLNEAFANVKDGDVIKLDWNVTLTENLETPTTGSDAKFTLDFNGYTISGNCGIYLKNSGDRLTLTDTSDDQLGGYKAGGLTGATGYEFVFDAGRYNLGGATAEELNNLCADTSAPATLAGGKEFIDLAGGAEANNGFTTRIDYKAFELTIGAGRFATFYDDNNVKLAEGTPTGVGLYTITAVDNDHTTATSAALTGPVAKNTPMLVYNGTDAKQTVKIKATNETANTANASVTPLVNFQGTATDKEFNDMSANDYYVLSGGSAFFPVYSAGTIGAHKCWLEFAKPSTARSINIVFDNGETTGLSEKGIVNSEKFATAEWYDLNGRKLNAAPKRKGVYIRNGQKEVVK